jgi:two-component system, OmpR family, sensor histidine kinase VicK
MQKQYQDYLKKFTAKKDAILHIPSLDLAGPLGMISNLADMLQTDLKAHPNQQVSETIRIIQKSSQQGEQLTKEFMKQEFFESPETAVIKQRVDLVQIIRKSREEYQQNQQLTGKKFHYLPATDTLFLELDDLKFMQALNNLISNALKFTPDGGEVTLVLKRILAKN